MSNWVKNNVSIIGNKQSLIEFQNKHIRNNEFANQVWGFDYTDNEDDNFNIDGVKL
jgi:hypothetical protein